MGKQQEEAIDRIFHALSDATRRGILLRIADSERTVGELAEPYKMSLAAVSKHLKVLERAGLLTRNVDGRVHRCTMNANPLEQAQEIIQRYRDFWKGRLDALEEYLNRVNQVPTPGSSKERGRRKI